MTKFSMPTLQSTIMHDRLNKSTMEIFTVQEWEERFEELFERVENGERIGIVGDNGHAAVMVPADDELIRIYSENNNEAS
jgi:antitoxin (DNA-binding transcriptional repressor) of toxin-antitoxin stability system